jgi:hypothetical protein
LWGPTTTHRHGDGLTLFVSVGYGGGQFVFGIEMGGGKDEIMNEMMSLDHQSDVLITDEQLSDVLTIHVQVTPLLGTDSVENTISTHDRSGTRERPSDSTH